MAPRPPLSLVLDQRRLNGAVSRFLARQAPAAVHTAVRKIAFDVARETVTAMNGLDGTPKRIDTGRLRAAWSVASKQAVGWFTGKATVLPRSPKTGRPNPPKATDGEGYQSGRGLMRTATVINNVEYAQDVEYGTATMAPGLHLTRALRVVARRVDPTVKAELVHAWRT
jgi:hypothetical protein